MRRKRLQRPEPKKGLARVSRAGIRVDHKLVCLATVEWREICLALDREIVEAAGVEPIGRTANRQLVDSSIGQKTQKATFPGPLYNYYQNRVDGASDADAKNGTLALPVLSNFTSAQKVKESFYPFIFRRRTFGLERVPRMPEVGFARFILIKFLQAGRWSS